MCNKIHRSAIKTVGRAVGEPHFQTMDSLEYTFNGLGEYWMVKSESFELQARTVRAWNTERQPSRTGTVFSAVTGRALYEESNETVSSARVHVEMTSDRTTGESTDVFVQVNVNVNVNIHLYCASYNTCNDR